MSFFMCVLQVLEVLTILAAINVFEFDKLKRKFEVRLSLQRIVAYISNTTLVLTIVFTTVIMVWCSVMITSIFLGMLNFKYVSGEAMALSMFLLCATKLYVIIYVNFLLKFRLDRILQVLNDFVACYDLHALVYASPLCINWFVLLCWTITTLLFDPFFWIAFMTAKTLLAFLLVYALLLPSTLLSLTSIFGVTVLEALYATVELDTANYRSTKLLHFYDRIQQLRWNLDGLVSFNILLELFVGLAAVTFGVIQFLGGDLFLPVVLTLLPLSYSVFLTYCTDSMNMAERKIGAQLVRKHRKNSFKREKVLQLWLLGRMCILSASKRRMRALHIKKAVLLDVASYGFIFGMFVINYVLVST